MAEGDPWAEMTKIRTSRGFGSAAFLLLAAGARAQQCVLAMLQSHLPGPAGSVVPMVRMKL